jgi:hypothetical protein
MVEDYVKEMDALYVNRANINIPLGIGFGYCTFKLQGQATTSQLEQLRHECWRRAPEALVDAIFEACDTLVNARELGEQRILVPFDQVTDTCGFFQEHSSENVCQVVKMKVDAAIQIADPDVGEHRTRENRENCD